MTEIEDDRSVFYKLKQKRLNTYFFMNGVSPIQLLECWNIFICFPENIFITSYEYLCSNVIAWSIETFTRQSYNPREKRKNGSSRTLLLGFEVDAQTSHSRRDQ